MGKNVMSKNLFIKPLSLAVAHKSSVHNDKIKMVSIANIVAQFCACAIKILGIFPRSKILFARVDKAGKINANAKLCHNNLLSKVFSCIIYSA